MKPSPIVLLTDFGYQDSYAGVLKGVIANLAPRTRVLDLTHGLPPYQILTAAFELYRSFKYFPKGSVFICVVDPGVGGSRKAILAKTKDYTFIAPDNGLLTMVLAKAKELRLLELNQTEYHLSSVSSTFHARDIFAPVAAHLCLGIHWLKLGTPLSGYKKLPECFPILKQNKKKKSAQGCILSIDNFGNGITNFSQEWIKANFNKGLAGKLQLELIGTKRSSLDNWARHYEAISSKAPSLIFGSSGFLEIACRESSAAEKLKLKLGQEVKLF